MSTDPTETDEQPRRREQRLFGVYLGVVLDNQDPLQLGTWLIPDVDDEILLAFEGGDPARPSVIGSLWGSASTPPEQMAPGNPVMSIVSAAGSRVTVDDRPEQLSIRLVTPGGRSVTLADAGGTITIDGGGGTIAITHTGIEIQAAGAVRLTAAAAEIRAGSLELNCSLTRATGNLECDTLIATNVIASSYSPGAGNLL